MGGVDTFGAKSPDLCLFILSSAVLRQSCRCFSRLGASRQLPAAGRTPAATTLTFTLHGLTLTDGPDASVPLPLHWEPVWFSPVGGPCGTGERCAVGVKVLRMFVAMGFVGSDWVGFDTRDAKPD